MLKKAVEICLLSDKIPYLESPPGWGKSALAKMLGQQFNLPVFIVYLGHRAGNEIHGLAVVSREPIQIGNSVHTVVESAPPRVLIEALQAAGQRGGAILFFDELNQVSPHDIGPVMAIFSERRWADIDLPRDQIAIMAAGNPVRMSAGGWKFPLPVRRRVVRIPVQLDAAEFAKPSGFASNWGYPLPVISKFGKVLDQQAVLRARTLLASWVHANPNCFEIQDVGKASEDSYVCPATLEDAADLMAAGLAEEFETTSMRDAVLEMILGGAVSPGAANSILDFYRNLDTRLDAVAALDNSAWFINQGIVPSPGRLYYFLMSIVGEQRNRLKTRGAESLDSWLAACHLLAYFMESGCATDLLGIAAASLMSPEVKPAAAVPPIALRKLRPVVEDSMRAGVQFSQLAG